MSDPVIAPDLREDYEIVCRCQNRSLILCKQLIERVSKAEQENVALRAELLRLIAARGLGEESQRSSHEPAVPPALL